MDAGGSSVLPGSECMRLLATAANEATVGRIGVPTDRAPVILPVNFVLRRGQVVVRVGAGFLSQQASGRLVAFEVDHVDSAAGVAWSVLVRGLATLVTSPTDAEISLAPSPLVPEPGTMVLTVRPDVVTGRRFVLSGGSSPPSIAGGGSSNSGHLRRHGTSPWSGAEQAPV